MTNNDRDLIMSKLSELTKEDLFMSYEDALKWAEWEANAIRSDAKKAGLAEGQVIGREESIILTIKNMLNKNFSLEDISDITGKNVDEIKKYME